MKKFELESMKDLAYLAVNSPNGTIQHFQDESGSNVYYVTGGTVEETFIFYVKGEEIKTRFISLNTSRDKIEFSDSPLMDPRANDIPIIKVKKQDLVEF